MTYLKKPLPIWCLTDLNVKKVFEGPHWRSPSPCLFCPSEEEDLEPSPELLRALEDNKIQTAIWDRVSSLQIEISLQLNLGNLEAATQLLTESLNVARLQGWDDFVKINEYQLGLVQIMSHDYLAAELKLEYVDYMHTYSGDEWWHQSFVILQTFLWLLTGGNFGTCPSTEVFETMANERWQSSKVLAVYGLVLVHQGEDLSGARTFMKASHVALAHGLVAHSYVYAAFGAWAYDCAGEGDRAKAIYSDLVKRQMEIHDAEFRETVLREAQAVGVPTKGM